MSDTFLGPIQSTVNAGYTYNFNRRSLPKTSVAIAAAISGSTDSTFIWSGDSTTTAAGAGTGGTTNLNAARPNSFCTQVSKLLTNKGIYADNDARFGFQNVDSVSVALGTYDPGINLGTWISANSQTFWSFGANMFRSNANAAVLTITPTFAWDSVDIYSVRNGGNGTANVAIGGSAATPATLDTSVGGSLVVIKSTYTAASNAIQALTLTSTSTANIYISGFVFHNSQKKGIKFLQAGMYGRKINDFVASSTSAWAPQNMLATVQAGSNATTHFIEVTINDINAPTNLTSYLSDMDSYVASSQAAGLEVVLVTGWQSNTSTNPNFVNFQQYYEGIRAIALSRNCAFVNMGVKMGPYTPLNSLGEMFDGLHPNAIGYADKALYFSELLNSLVVGT